MSKAMTRPELNRTKATIETLLQTMNAADDLSAARQQTQCLLSISQALRDISKQCRQSAEETRARSRRIRYVRREMTRGFGPRANGIVTPQDIFAR